jgi:hypothetical protein
MGYNLYKDLYFEIPDHVDPVVEIWGPYTDDNDDYARAVTVRIGELPTAYETLFYGRGFKERGNKYARLVHKLLRKLY